MISPFGLAVGAIGALALAMPLGWALALIVLFAPFRTAMAFSPPGMGGASVLVPHFFLLFLVLRVLRRFGPGPLVAAFTTRSAGFPLALLVAYGLVAALFFPRAFAGITETVSLQRAADGDTVLVLTPLAFGGTYLTQGIYALGGLASFAAAFALFRPGAFTGARAATSPWHLLLVAMLGLGALNVALAAVDLLTHATGTDWLLGFMRNASYGLLTDAEKGGLKRITGSFSEASAFAVFTLAMFAFAVSIWLDRVAFRRLSGALALLLGGLLLAATSGTGYVGFVLVVAFLAARQTGLSKGGRAGRRLAALMGFTLILLAALLATLALMPAVVEAVRLFIAETVLDKAASQSGTERAMWNAVAFQNALDTWGFGVGIGGARASSYALILLSNVGVPGVVLYLVFARRILFARPTVPLDPREVTTLRAARAALIGFLVGHVLVGTIFDQSPIFYLLCGAIAAATLAPRRVLAPPAKWRGGLPDHPVPAPSMLAAAGGLR